MRVILIFGLNLMTLCACGVRFLGVNRRLTVWDFPVVLAFCGYFSAADYKFRLQTYLISGSRKTRIKCDFKLAFGRRYL